MSRANLCYLSAPYAHGDPDVRHSRRLAVNRAAARLMAAGRSVFSPLTHSERIAVILDNPLDADFWHEQNKPMMEAATEVVILTLPGWDESQGVALEIEMAAELGVPVFFMEPVREECPLDEDDVILGRRPAVDTEGGDHD